MLKLHLHLPKFESTHTVSVRLTTGINDNSDDNGNNKDSNEMVRIAV